MVLWEFIGRQKLQQEENSESIIGIMTQVSDYRGEAVKVM